MAALTPFSALSGHRSISLTTFRKSGQAVATPVWFAEVDNKLYVTTPSTSGKAKRLRHNSSVTVAPCTGDGVLLGPTVPAVARILPSEESVVARRALSRKYGWPLRFYTLLWKLQRSQRVYLEIAYQENGELGS